MPSGPAGRSRSGRPSVWAVLGARERLHASPSEPAVVLRHGPSSVDRGHRGLCLRRALLVPQLKSA